MASQKHDSDKQQEQQSSLPVLPGNKKKEIEEDWCLVATDIIGDETMIGLRSDPNWETAYRVKRDPAIMTTERVISANVLCTPHCVFPNREITML